MTSDPTPDAPSTAPAPVADYVASNRTPVAVALLAVGVVCLAVGGYYLAKGFNAAKAEKKADKSEKPDETAASEVEIADPNRPAYFAAGILGVFGAVVGVGVGGSLLARPPKPDPAARRAEARTTILLAGGLFGFVLMLAGLWFFYLWFGSLTAWLDQGKRGEAKWVLGPILVFVLGAALAFAAAQPARAEERNNPLLRRLVYGSNLGLTALLLLLVLTVGNVFAAVRVPNQLDVTESGFYTLDDSTRQVIADLDQPVTAYSTLSESLARDDTDARMIRDARNLLTAAQDVNPSKFRVRSLSPQLDQAEVSRLAAKFPQFDKQDMGILLVAGEDESRASFIRFSELFTTDFEGRTPTVVFQGEARLVRELLFLSEGKTRPVVYFTQGHGELEIAPPPPGAEARPAGVRTANQLRTALEQNYVDVKPLEFDLANPKVPDDATVVVVADPRTPLPKEQAEAIRKFMTEPRPGDAKKKGKLIVLTSPHPKPDGTGVEATGLEDVLAGFGVRLGREYILNQPMERVSYTEAITALNAGLVDARNPIALAFSDRVLVLPDCREVAPVNNPANRFRAEPLFLTNPQRYTWLESDPPTNPARTWEELRQAASADLRRAKQFSRSPRSLSVLVSEPPEPGAKGANPTARVAVYGSGSFFADPDRRGRTSQTPAELFAATLDWLRDRPVVNIANKNYHQYTLKAEPDAARILYLPVGVTVLGVLAVGFGMWVFRQK